MKLNKKQQKLIEKQAMALKKMYESPCEEAQELLRKANESSRMPSGLTQQEEIEWILEKSKTNNL